MMLTDLQGLSRSGGEVRIKQRTCSIACKTRTRYSESLMEMLPNSSIRVTYLASAGGCARSRVPHRFSFGLVMGWWSACPSLVDSFRPCPSRPGHGKSPVPSTPWLQHAHLSHSTAKGRSTTTDFIHAFLSFFHSQTN